jgi:hypothetical protein
MVMTKPQQKAALKHVIEIVFNESPNASIARVLIKATIPGNDDPERTKFLLSVNDDAYEDGMALAAIYCCCAGSGHVQHLCLQLQLAR